MVFYVEGDCIYYSFFNLWVFYELLFTDKTGILTVGILILCWLLRSVLTVLGLIKLLAEPGKGI